MLILESDGNISSVKSQRVRGMRDFLPDEMDLRKYISSIMRNVIESYAFREVMTPALEHLEVLEARSGRMIKEQLYWFEDKSERKLGLRFDGTVPVARLIAGIGPSLPKPIKFYYIDRFWRYEEISFGRWREFWHAGIEMFGAVGSIADAEVISCFCDVFSTLGIGDFKIAIGNRKILEGFIKTFDIKTPVEKPTQENQMDIIRVLDKKNKVSRDEMINELKCLGVADSDTDELLKLIDFQGIANEVLPRAERLLPSEKKISEGIKELKDVTTALSSYGVIDKVEVDLSLARGFDYYTGTIFECIPPNEQKYGSLGGGGRYDALVNVYGGASIPATGFAIGLDRTITYLKSENLIDLTKMKYSPQCYVASINAKCRAKAIELCQRLRRKGLIVEIDTMDRSFKNQLEQATKFCPKRLIVVGPKELEEGFVTIKDFETRTETKVPFADVELVLQ